MAGVLGQSSTSEPIFLGLGLRNGVWHCCGYPSGQNFSKQQLVFDDGLHALIAETRTKLLTNFNHSKLMIAFNKVTNRCDILWGDVGPWVSLTTCVLHGISSSTKLFAGISLASSIVLIPRIVWVIYTKFHWAQRFCWLGTLLQHAAQ